MGPKKDSKATVRRSTSRSGEGVQPPVLSSNDKEASSSMQDPVTYNSGPRRIAEFIEVTLWSNDTVNVPKIKGYANIVSSNSTCLPPI